MKAINVGPTTNESANGIGGRPGKIIDMKDLPSRIKTKTNISRVHGDRDQIVPPSNW
jgi:hypothetical protein